MRKSAFVLAVLCACAFPHAVRASTLPSGSGLSEPYEIFARAKSNWERQRYPALLQYVVHVSADRSGSPEDRHYHARWVARTNGIAIDLVSDEQRQHPYHVPPGVNFYGASIGGRRVGEGVADDLLGVPVVSPNYSFGIADYVPPQELSPAQLVEEIRAEFHDPNPKKVSALAAGEGLKVIASVSTSHADYTITLSGVERRGAHADYHLRLQPRHDPNRLRLRDVWVDAQTFATHEVIASGNFEQSATTKVLWTVTFDSVGGHQYIESETAMSSMSAGARGTYNTYRITLEGLGPASATFSSSFGNAAKLSEPTHR